MFGPLIVKPRTSRKNKTGSWRTELKPKYLRENCIACKFCVVFCPEGCVEGSEKNTYGYDYDYCKGCGICAKVCPKQDIRMVSEEEK